MDETSGKPLEAEELDQLVAKIFATLGSPSYDDLEETAITTLPGKDADD